MESVPPINRILKFPLKILEIGYKVVVGISLFTGWWFEPTPLQNDGVRQFRLLFPIYGKIKYVPNHQPVYNPY